MAGIEGPNLLEEALRAGLRVALSLLRRARSICWKALPLPAETEVLLLPRELLDSALSTETPQPVAALVEPPDWSWADVLAAARRKPLR